ncbi:hypothetical protein E4N80_05755 [Treponema denticola]|uniref:Pycsar system effector family protein n=1 Tax=Treponema denticola TaxID=158 RepID=UPI0020A41385|nr:Pycsar system effector family protein [Treponema denticola]UTD05011.1 hypothetical protein E4N80_05755 [Treponema denticola]
MKENDLLKFIFENVNHWLEFAEKKNSYLFSVYSINSLVIVILTSIEKTKMLPKYGVIIFIILYVIALFVSILSIFPNIKISQKLLTFGKNKKINKSDNLLFYGDVSKYSFDEYKKVLIDEYKLEDRELKLDEDLLKQIIINSNIAVFKYKCFKLSSIFLSLAALLLFIFMVKVII